MTDDLKNKLFRKKYENSADYVDADNFSIYNLISKNKKLLFLFCGIFMFLEVFVIGSVSYFFENHFHYQLIPAFLHGFACVPFTYIVWGITLILFSVLYLFRYRSNPRFDDERRYTKSHLGTYGTADWMQEEEFDKFLQEVKVEKTEETILGCIDNKVVTAKKDIHPKDALNPHIFVLGASGSRKTRTYVFNAIFQAIRRGESVIMSDPKGELYRETYTLFKKHGYNTKCFNVKEPLKSDHWAVLSEAEKGTDYAQVLCDVIIKNTGGEKGDQFFNQAELNLLKAVVLFVASSQWHKDHGLNNMKGVYDMILSCNDPELMAETLGSFVSKNPDHPSYQPYQVYEGAGRVKSNILVGLGSRLNLFQNERITDICSFNEEKEIDLEAPLKEKCAYFVITSDQESSREVLSSLFFSFLFIDQVDYFDRNIGKKDFKPLKVNYILDEFINCGIIPDMDKKITTVRSRGLCLSLIVQNIGQMKDRYKYNWESLISNCDTTLILSVGKNDSTTAKWVSDILGTQTVEAVSNVQTYSKSSVLKIAGEYKETKGIGKRQLLSPDEITSLPRDKEILLFSAHHPLLLNKYDYSNHPMSAEMSQIADEFDDEMRLGMIDTEVYMQSIARKNGISSKQISNNAQLNAGPTQHFEHKNYNGSNKKLTNKDYADKRRTEKEQEEKELNAKIDGDNELDEETKAMVQYYHPVEQKEEKQQVKHTNSANVQPSNEFLVDMYQKKEQESREIKQKEREERKKQREAAKNDEALNELQNSLFSQSLPNRQAVETPEYTNEAFDDNEDEEENDDTEEENETEEDDGTEFYDGAEIFESTEEY